MPTHDGFLNALAAIRKLATLAQRRTAASRNLLSRAARVLRRVATITAHASCGAPSASQAIPQRHRTLLASALLGLAPLSCQALLAGDDCPEVDYVGWRCHEFTVVPPNSDAGYQIRLRWNRPEHASQGTVLWLAGGNGSKPHSEIDRPEFSPDGRSVRDRLDHIDGIRSIEVQFIDPATASSASGISDGGYWKAPRTGYLRPAVAYLQLLEMLGPTQFDLLDGNWTTQMAGSNGATLMAFALAYLEIEQFIDKFVMVSGPFLTDVIAECSDPAHPAYIGVNDASPGAVTTQEIDHILGFVHGVPLCSAIGASSAPDGLLDSDAKTEFPRVEIEVIIGDQDPYGPWLLASNLRWFNRVNAGSQQRTVLAGAGHNIPTHFPSSVDTLYAALNSAPINPDTIFQVGSNLYSRSGDKICYIPNWETYLSLTDNSTDTHISQFNHFPSHKNFSGICGENLLRGLFIVANSAIYYSNGTAVCYVPSMDDYFRLTGRQNIDDLRNFPQLPTSFTGEGICAG